MTTLEKKITLSQNREIYHTLVKVNEGYYTAKLNGQTVHLKLSYIVQNLDVLDDIDKTRLTNPMKVRDLTKMALVAW